MSIFSILNNKYAAWLGHLTVFVLFAVAVMVPRSLAFILLAPGLLIFISLALGKKLPAIDLKILGSLLTAAFVVIAINLFVSINFEVSSERLMKLSGLFLLGGLSLWGYSGVAVKFDPRFLSAGITAVVICSIFILSELVFDLPFLRAIEYRDGNPKAHVYNRSVVAIVLLVPLILALRWSVQGRQKVDAILAVIATAVIMLSASQAAQLALLMAALVLIAMPFKNRVFWIGLQVSIVVLLFVSPLLVTALHDFAMGHEDVLRHPVIQAGAAGSRLEVWNGIAALIAEKPILGHGIGVTRELTVESANRFWRFDSVLHPHNFALQLWLEFGVLGALWGSAVLVYFIEKIRSLDDKWLQKAALINLFGWLAIAGTGYGMWQSWWVGVTLSMMVFWGCIGKMGKADV